MQKIVPHLWFNNNAEEAAEFYASNFKDSRVGAATRFSETGAQIAGKPKGSVMSVSFILNGKEYVGINGGTYFTFTPANSLFVSCETAQEIDKLWNSLLTGGMALMELGEYPFSKRFGWLQDRFGLSWQFSLTGEQQKISPFLMFVGDQHGRAEEAMKVYTSIFKGSGIQKISRYESGEIGAEGTVKHASFKLDGHVFMAIDAPGDHPFTFSPAVSFMVNCETQSEIDMFWQKLGDGGVEEQCGWLRDRFGVSWQVVPAELSRWLGGGDSSKSERVMEAMLQMKKLDISQLKRAHDQS